MRGNNAYFDYFENKSMNENNAMAEVKPEPKKWTNSSGPIQLKQVQAAMSAIVYEGRTVTEKWGTIGIDESEHSMQAMFGPIRKECADALVMLGDEFSWNITRDNYKAVIASADRLVQVCKLSRPVQDTRVTPEVDAERRVERERIEAEQVQKEATRRAEIAAEAPKIRSQFPWAAPAEAQLSRTARASSNARTELHAAFPGIKFQVRCDSGHGLHVNWYMGPTEDEVRTMLEKYRAGKPDEAMAVVMGHAYHVWINRIILEPAKVQVAQLICKAKGVVYSGMDMKGLVDNEAADADLGDHVRQAISQTTFPCDAEIIDVQPATSETDVNVNFQIKQKFPRSPVTFTQSTALPMNGAGGVIVAFKIGQNGGKLVTLTYPGKPDEAERAKIKQRGFRWHMQSKTWWRGLNPLSWQIAHEIAAITDIPAYPGDQPQP